MGNHWKQQKWGELWQENAKGTDLYNNIDEDLGWPEISDIRRKIGKIKGAEGWGRDESELMRRMKAVVSHAWHRHEETEGHKIQIRSWNTGGMSNTTIAEKAEGGETVRSTVIQLASKGVILVQDHKMGPKNLDRLVTEHRNLGIAAAEAIEANAGQRKYRVAVRWNSYKIRQPAVIKVHWEGRVVSAKFYTKAGPVTYVTLHLYTASGRKITEHAHEDQEIP